VFFISIFDGDSEFVCLQHSSSSPTKILMISKKLHYARKKIFKKVLGLFASVVGAGQKWLLKY